MPLLGPKSTKKGPFLGPMVETTGRQHMLNNPKYLQKTLVFIEKVALFSIIERKNYTQITRKRQICTQIARKKRRPEGRQYARRTVTSIYFFSRISTLVSNWASWIPKLLCCSTLLSSLCKASFIVRSLSSCRALFFSFCEMMVAMLAMVGIVALIKATMIVLSIVFFLCFVIVISG